MFVARSNRIAVLCATAALAAGCDGPSGSERLSVTMQQSDAATSPSLSGWNASVTGSSGSAVSISKDMVLSLDVNITEIQFLPREYQADAANAGAWVSLEFGQSASLDLMALPTEGESPLVIASGSAPVGSYVDVRLFVSDAKIVFASDVQLGTATVFKAGESYDVTIASGDQTGIKTDAQFAVEADAEGNINDVHLFFNPTATFLNVSATGTGSVMLSPVIRSLPDGA